MAVIGLPGHIQQPGRMGAGAVQAPFLGAGVQDFGGMVLVAVGGKFAPGGRGVGVDGKGNADYGGLLHLSGI